MTEKTADTTAEAALDALIHAATTDGIGDMRSYLFARARDGAGIEPSEVRRLLAIAEKSEERLKGALRQFPIDQE